MLEQDITRKGRVDEKVTELEFETSNSKKYEMEAIWDSTIYGNKADGHLLSLYYLVMWKRHPEEKNTWEPSSAVQHLKNLINSFHKEHPKKLTATFPPINSTLLVARPTVKPTKPITKRKRGQPANSANK